MSAITDGISPVDGSQRRSRLHALTEYLPFMILQNIHELAMVTDCGLEWMFPEERRSRSQRRAGVVIVPRTTWHSISCYLNSTIV